MGNAAIFLDRDDTIIEDPGYINSPDQVKLLPGAADALSQLKKMGYKLVVVTNQSAVARGMVSEEVLEEIHERLRRLLGRKRVYLDGIYYCPYHPEAVIPKYRRDSDFRKPNPGMIFQAAEELGIDLKQSWMIGNTYSDVTAGVNAGCKTILIRSSLNPPKKEPADPDPDKIAVNIKEAVNVIKMFRQQSMMTPRPAAAPGIVSLPEQETVQEQSEPSPAADVENDVADEQEPAAPKAEKRPARPRKAAAKKRPRAAAGRSMTPAQVKAQTQQHPVQEPLPEAPQEVQTPEPEPELQPEPEPEAEAETEPQPAPQSQRQPEPRIEQVRRQPAAPPPHRQIQNEHAPSTASGRRFVEPRGGRPTAHTAPPSPRPSSADASATQDVLNEVMRYLKKVDRLNLYDEFSWLKVLAGGLQVVVFFFLLLGLWFLMDPTRDAADVHTVLLYAAVLQLTAIAFHLMRDRR